MAHQSLKELDAEQTCQEMLALSPENTDINNLPSTRPHLSSLLPLFVKIIPQDLTAL